jgi:hypothetical protein
VSQFLLCCVAKNKAVLENVKQWQMVNGCITLLPSYAANIAPLHSTETWHHWMTLA